MEYKTIRYTPSYLASLTKLITITFSIENRNKKALLQWKYFDPFFNSKSITYIALDKENNVVGHYSSMPITVTQGENVYKSTLSTDAATDPDHRGKGIMSRLAKALYSDVKNQGYAFSFGFPNEVGVVMDKYSKNYGYQLIGVFAKYARLVFSPKKITYSLIKVNTQDEIETIESTNDNYFTLQKDKDYLIWRYIKKPNREYEVYRIIEKRKTIGYVILRFTRIKCYVYDIITDLTNKSSLQKVFQAIENTAFQHRRFIVVYTVLDNTYWQSLFRFPYVKKFYNRSSYYFSVHLHKQNLPSTILEKDHWLLMSGDIL